MSFFSATRRTLLVSIGHILATNQLNRSLHDQPSEITHQLLQKPDPVSSFDRAAIALIIQTFLSLSLLQVLLV
jgi:hypothetical protein